MIHRGNVAHAAHPIQNGERYNLVLWLYGERMQTPHHSMKTSSSTPLERWSQPMNTSDDFAPFSIGLKPCCYIAKN